MPSPFPGMDPYLEDPAIWSGVHSAFLGAIFERLGPVLRPKYAVRFEERVYVTSEDDPGYRHIVPDVRVIERDPVGAITSYGSLAIAEPMKVVHPEDDEVRESNLQILDLRDRSIVTVIEMLSPTNKISGSFGRTSFLQKRREVFATEAHWLEIDLLRDGIRTANLPGIPNTEYQAYLSRAGQPRQGFVWPMSLRERLPVIGVPLRGTDADMPIDLQAVLDSVIERGSYDLDTDYRAKSVPPLEGDAMAWAQRLLARNAPL